MELSHLMYPRGTCSTYSCDRRFFTFSIKWLSLRFTRPSSVFIRISPPSQRFHDLSRGLYVDEGKRRTIEELMESHLLWLECSDKFTGESGGELEAPTVYLWCLYFLAQHYDLQGNVWFGAIDQG